MTLTTLSQLGVFGYRAARDVRGERTGVRNERDE